MQETAQARLKRVGDNEMKTLLPVSAVALLGLASLASPASPAVTSGSLKIELLVTSVDQDIYLARPNPAVYPDHSSQIYLRTKPCSHRSADEPALASASQEEDRLWLVFYDGDLCEITNVSRDRGGI